MINFLDKFSLFPQVSESIYPGADPEFFKGDEVGGGGGVGSLVPRGCGISGDRSGVCALISAVIFTIFCFNCSLFDQKWGD